MLVELTTCNRPARYPQYPSRQSRHHPECAACQSLASFFNTRRFPMRGTCLGFFAGLAVIAGSTLAGGGDKAADGELKKIQGAWKFLAHERDGKATPAEELKKLKITFTGDKFSVE